MDCGKGEWCVRAGKKRDSLLRYLNEPARLETAAGISAVLAEYGGKPKRSLMLHYEADSAMARRGFRALFVPYECGTPDVALGVG